MDEHATPENGMAHSDAIPSSTIIVNPLGVALSHYTAGLAGHFERAGSKTMVIDFPEPSHRPDGRFAWIREYSRSLAEARTTPNVGRLVVTWPVIGALDVLLTSRPGPHVSLVLHDPKPLARSIGYDRLSRHLANRWGKTEILVHSPAALEDARAILPRLPIRLLPLPIVPRPPRSRTDKTIRVIGQYKPSRSIAALLEIAAAPPQGFKLEIIGRGWPTVPGWSTVDRFVPESEFQLLLSTSAAVVIPYNRFYQSGIAMQCLELGVPFVGPEKSSLSEILPEHSPLLANDGGWAAAVSAAVATSVADMTKQRDRYVQRADDEIAKLVRLADSPR